MQRNTLIKDMMRESCLMDLAQFWFNIIVIIDIKLLFLLTLIVGFFYF